MGVWQMLILSILQYYHVLQFQYWIASVNLEAKRNHMFTKWWLLHSRGFLQSPRNPPSTLLTSLLLFTSLWYSQELHSRLRQGSHFQQNPPWTQPVLQCPHAPGSLYWIVWWVPVQSDIKSCTIFFCLAAELRQVWDWLTCKLGFPNLFD